MLAQGQGIMDSVSLDSTERTTATITTLTTISTSIHNGHAKLFDKVKMNLLLKIIMYQLISYIARVHIEDSFVPAAITMSVI